MAENRDLTTSASVKVYVEEESLEAVIAGKTELISRKTKNEWNTYGSAIHL